MQGACRTQARRIHTSEQSEKDHDVTTSQRYIEAMDAERARQVIVTAPEAANEVTPEWLHERWSEVLDTDAEDDLMYSMRGPVTKVIVALLLGAIAAIVLIATGTMTDPGLRP